MVDRSDIVIVGTGSFAARIVFDLAATASRPTRVLIAGRNGERLAWLRTAANARSAMFGRPVRFDIRRLDIADQGAASSLIATARPTVVAQAASLQNASVIAGSGNAWAKLVADGGLSSTAVFQTVLSSRVARAVREVSPGTFFINCCFPDVVNGLIKAMGLPITCGIGNIAILAHAFAGTLGEQQNGALRVLAHYQDLSPWRQPPTARQGPGARVWLGGTEIADVYGRFRDVQLTPEPAIDISGASAVPVMMALAHGLDWRGHVPGPDGLPGGYPVKLGRDGVELDLPEGLDRDAAVRWNAAHEEANGLVVAPDGQVRYTGRLASSLAKVSTALAAGFHVADLEDVHHDMQALRERLLAIPA